MLADRYGAQMSPVAVVAIADLYGISGRRSELLASSLDYETTLKNVAQIVVPGIVGPPPAILRIISMCWRMCSPCLSAPGAAGESC